MPANCAGLRLPSSYPPSSTTGTPWTKLSREHAITSNMPTWVKHLDPGQLQQLVSDTIFTVGDVIASPAFSQRDIRQWDLADLGCTGRTPSTSFELSSFLANALLANLATLEVDAQTIYVDDDLAVGSSARPSNQPCATMGKVPFASAAPNAFCLCLVNPAVILAPFGHNGPAISLFSMFALVLALLCASTAASAIVATILRLQQQLIALQADLQHL